MKSKTASEDVAALAVLFSVEDFDQENTSDETKRNINDFFEDLNFENTAKSVDVTETIRLNNFM